MRNFGTPLARTRVTAGVSVGPGSKADGHRERAGALIFICRDVGRAAREIVFEVGGLHEPIEPMHEPMHEPNARIPLKGPEASGSLVSADDERVIHPREAPPGPAGPSRPRDTREDLSTAKTAVTEASTAQSSHPDFVSKSDAGPSTALRGAALCSKCAENNYLGKLVTETQGAFQACFYIALQQHCITRSLCCQKL